MLLVHYDKNIDCPKMLSGGTTLTESQLLYALGTPATAAWQHLKSKKTREPTIGNLVLILTGEEGFEPPLTVLETVALPLNYSPSLLT